MSDVELKVSQDFVKPILEQKIKMALIESMGGSEQFVSALIESYMQIKCGADGKISQYSSDNKYTLLDATLRTMITGAIKDAVQKWAVENQSVISEELAKYFKSKSGSNVMVKAIQSGLVESMSKGWGISVTLQHK